MIPSPRISDRVPFGTGKAIGLMQDMNETVYFTYHPQSFLDLKVLVDGLQKVYSDRIIDLNISDGLSLFLKSANAEKELERIFQNTTDFQSFKKMFWHWFDAFILMKYLHFVRDRDLPDIPVLEAVNIVSSSPFASATEVLIYYRESDIL